MAFCSIWKVFARGFDSFHQLFEAFVNDFSRFVFHESPAFCLGEDVLSVDLFRSDASIHSHRKKSGSWFDL